MRPRGLGTKLLGVTLGLLAVLTAGSLLTVRHHFGQQLRKEAVRQIRVGSRVLTSIVERSGAQLMDRGRVLAELPSLRNALLKDHKQLEPLLLEVKAVRAANLLWVTDASGAVLACTGEYPPPGQDLSQQPLTFASLKGKSTLGFDLFGDAWWLVLSFPVRQTGSEQVLGTVNMALLVGDAYLARLSELIGAKIGLVWGENQIWSEGWPEEIRHQVKEHLLKGLSENPSEIVDPREGRFLWLGRALTGGEPPIATAPIAVLGIRLDESVIQRSTRAIVWIALLTMLLGAALSVGASRSITRPLKRLVSDAHKIGQGDLRHRSRVEGADEIGELAVSFNAMVGKLQTSYEELAQFNATLEQRVRERTQQLEEAQSQLLHAEKLASVGQLAAGVAHELNNPLMVILGNAQLALRMLTRAPQMTEALRPELVELLQALDHECHRAKSIVANLLDFVRVKPPIHQPVDVNSLLDESLQLVDHQASLQSVEVKRDYQKDLPPVLGDPGQLKQVFVNVILNAVQAMPEGGRLILKTALHQGRIRVTISDTGSGIPEDKISKVFDPFFTTKEVGRGTGLGLFISYGIIQRHEGTLQISSKPGKGTEMVIELPGQPPG